MKRAAIYLRISRDREGLELGVQRQEQDCRALAEREGYEVVHVYRDNDIGASTLSKKSRPEYEAMLDAARAGDFEIVIAYSNSRLTRRLRELLDLIDLYNAHGTKVVTVVSGSDDLSTADGRMTAQIKGSVDQAEAERMGERIRRAHLQRAQSGTTNHGGRPFGWQDDKATIDNSEAMLIREAVADVLEGIGLRAITRRWNEAGVLTARGNEWDHRALRQLLRAPRLAGWRVHRGEIARDADGLAVRGVWEPILDQDTYDRLQVALSGRAGRSPGRRGARRYLLSGIARCGTCGARMYGSTTPAGHAYTCRKDNGGAGSHNVSVAGVPTDEAVSAVVVARLQGEDLATSTGDASPEFGQSERLEEIPAKIAELMGEYNAGRLSGAVVFPQVAKLESEQADLTVERDRFIAATSVPDMHHVDIDGFPMLNTDRQRLIIEQVLEAVVIAPSRKGAPWDPDRITYVWRQS
ncbi:recombinase family protein [Nocardioides immobilis]|uniref:recombinase family protein n=1 Tax=Nocardioides immobilis TaxID=2049295 RepID=UPI0015FC09C9|nr:recombinase family protein [Nocardioides immobilis]